MILDNIIDRQLNAMGERHSLEALREHLLAKYQEEPFPNQYTEQDLYENIRHDIQGYQAGKLDVALRAPLTECKQELEALQDLYIECQNEVRELRDYIDELETILLEHDLESPRAAKQRLRQQEDPYRF